MANIYWDYTEEKLVESIYTTNAVTDFTWVLRDLCKINLYAVTPQDDDVQPYVIGELPTTFTLKLEAKQEGEFKEDPLLCGSSWTLTGTGEDAVYTSDIRLDNEGLIAAVGELTELELVGEIARISDELENYNSTQFTITIIPDVIRDSDTCPIPIDYSSSSSVSSSSSSSVSSSSSSSTSSNSSSSSSTVNMSTSSLGFSSSSSSSNSSTSSDKYSSSSSSSTSSEGHSSSSSSSSSTVNQSTSSEGHSSSSSSTSSEGVSSSSSSTIAMSTSSLSSDKYSSSSSTSSNP